MITHRGQIDLNGKMILEGLTFHIFRTSGNQLGLVNWSGYFLFPLNPSNQEVFMLLSNERGPFRLILDDGRQAEFIQPSRSNFTHSIYQFDFQIDGELK